MKNVLVVVSSKDQVKKQTARCIDVLRQEGAGYVQQEDCSDVALARNIALSNACQVLRTKSYTIVLMIDDDMTFSLNDAQAVVKRAVERNRPVAGACVSASGQFAAKPMNKTAWLSGLAFIAIPAHLLLSLQDKSRIFDANGNQYTAFTWTGVEGKEWMGEDSRLSFRLGGVEVVPVRIGHLKLMPIYPAEEGQEKELGAFIMNALENYRG